MCTAFVVKMSFICMRSKLLWEHIFGHHVLGIRDVFTYI